MKVTAHFDWHFSVAAAAAWLTAALVRSAVMRAFGYAPNRGWDRIVVTDPDTTRTADEKRWGR